MSILHLIVFPFVMQTKGSSMQSHTMQSRKPSTKTVNVHLRVWPISPDGLIRPQFARLDADVQCSTSHDRNSQSANPAEFRCRRNSPGHGESCPILHSDKQMDRISAARCIASRYVEQRCHSVESLPRKDNDVYRQSIDFTSAVH